MDIVIGGIEEATPDWLTMILSQRGFLLKGKVQSLNAIMKDCLGTGSQATIGNNAGTIIVGPQPSNFWLP